MLNELQKALDDLKEKQIIYGIVDQEYEETAYQNLKEAEERVITIIREMKEGVKNDVCSSGRQAI